MTIWRFFAMVFQPVEKGRGRIRFLCSFPHSMTVDTFFLLRADRISCVFPMDTVLLACEVTAKEAAEAKAF